MDGVIEKRIVIHARPDTVYRALTESRYLAKWLADKADAKPVAGGSLLLYSGVGETAKGVDAAYTELVPGRTVRFRWIARIAGGQKTAERGHHENAFLIVESPDGVIVTMRDHEAPPPTDSERLKTEQGWDQVLVALKTLCEGPEAPGKEPPPAEWGDVEVNVIERPSHQAGGKSKKGAKKKPAKKKGKKPKKAKRAKKAKKARKRARPARRGKTRKGTSRKARTRGGKMRARKAAKRAARKTPRRKAARKAARKSARRKAARKAKPRKKAARKAKRAGARRKR